jgi:hypothetical protein
VFVHAGPFANIAVGNRYDFLIDFFRLDHFFSSPIFTISVCPGLLF